MRVMVLVNATEDSEKANLKDKLIKSASRPNVWVARCVGTGRLLAPVLQAGLENANIDAGWHWSEESR